MIRPEFIDATATGLGVLTAEHSGVSPSVLLEDLTVDQLRFALLVCAGMLAESIEGELAAAGDGRTFHDWLDCASAIQLTLAAGGDIA